MTQRQPGQGGVETGHQQRGDGHPARGGRQQLAERGKGGDGVAERHGRIDIPLDAPGTLARCPRGADCEQGRSAHVNQEEQHGETDRAEPISGLIIQHTPGQPNACSKGQTQHVELPPGPVDRGGEHAKIQHRKVAEQGDMTALARGGQNRCKKATDGGRDGESSGVLEQGQHERQGDQQRHAGQRDIQAEQAIESSCCV